MGTIRLLLALSVVAAHVGYPLLRGVSGQTAVQAFYIISGFYIAMALDGSYRRSVKTFWLNRGLRLFPVYWIVALLTLCYWLVTDPGYFDAIGALPGGAKLLLVISNIALLGQDWVMFTGVHNGITHFVANFRESDPQVWTLLLSPQAWSLGVELTFYASAPFIFRCRTLVVIALLAASLALRGVLIANGLSADPWSYRFFPTELALFLLGGMAYRGSKLWTVEQRQQKWATAIVIAMLVLYPAIKVPETVKNVIVVLVFAAFIPPIFDFSKSNRLDGFVGNLSYPLYISHWLVIMVAKRFFGAVDTFPLAAMTLAVSVAFALALSLAVDTPVQHVRARIREGQPQKPHALDGPRPALRVQPLSSTTEHGDQHSCTR